MSVLGFIILLLIAAVCGAIGQAIAGQSVGKGGFLISTGVGFIGALIGTWIAGEFGLPEVWVVHIDGESFPIIWSIIGGALLTVIIGSVSRRRK